MDLVAKASGGVNIVARPQARASWYPADTVRPARVEVYWRFEDEPPSAARLIGVYAPGAAVSYPFNPLADRNIYGGTISVAADGARSARGLNEAHWELLQFQRETDAPTVAQVGAATHTNIRLAIDGYSTLAIKRRIRVADDPGMTTALQVLTTTITGGEVLPRLVDLTRTDGGTGTRTIYVRVSHSSGGAYGSESVVAPFTYADNLGAGGGTGTEDPFFHREYNLP